MKVKKPTDKDIADQYRLYRNKLTCIKKESKKVTIEIHYQIICTTLPKFGRLNHIVRYKSKQKYNLPSIFIDKQNIILKDPVKISNSFNNYFADVGPLLAAKITSSNNRTVFQNPTAPQISASFF